MFHIDAGLAPPLPTWLAILRLSCDGVHPSWEVARAASVMLVDYFGLTTSSSGNNSRNSSKNSTKNGLNSPMGSPKGSFSNKNASEKEGGNTASTKGKTDHNSFKTVLLAPPFSTHTLVSQSHHTPSTPSVSSHTLSLRFLKKHSFILRLADDRSPEGSMTPTQRLHTAVRFLLHAIKLGNQRHALMKNSLGLGEDPTLTANNIPAELSALLVACTSSSATSDTVKSKLSDHHAINTKESAKKTPAAEGKNKAVAGAVAGLLTGRDAMLLLASTLREAEEVDPLWMDGYERDMCYDLHNGLKTLSPAYTQQCVIADPPSILPSTPEGTFPPLSVAMGSLSSLWIAAAIPKSTEKNMKSSPVKSEKKLGAEVGVGGMLSSGAPAVAGLYTHVTGYLLLGAIQSTNLNPSDKATLQNAKAPSSSTVTAPGTGNGSSSLLPDPVLTKISLYKPDVVLFEEGMRYLRTELAIASGIIPNPSTGVYVCC